MHRSFRFRSVLTVSVTLLAFGVPGFTRAQGPKPEPKAPPAPLVLADAEIRKILVQRIDTSHLGVGIVVGVIEPSGRRVIAHGQLAKGDPRPLDGKTIFEIGSATKVFTSLLLADMVQRGEVALTDPVAKFLPEGVKVPERDGKVITLQELASQTSGLPRLPTNLAPKDLANPYADYSPEQLFQFLGSYSLTREISSKYEYSNLGVGLLGQALARRAGMDFEQLVHTRIALPLGLKGTGVTLTPELKARFAVGHNEKLEPVPYWDLPTLAGAGALRSNAEDLLTLLAAHLGHAQSKLAPAMAAMLTPRKATGITGMEIALGWHISTTVDAELVWHNGGTGGFRSFLGFNPKTKVGVVVLANTGTVAGVDDIGRHLLDSHLPLLPPPKQHTEIALAPKLMDGLVGLYKLTPNFFLTITREGDGLFAQATGQARAQLFPEGPRAFFFKVVDAQITFEVDPTGKATALVLHQGGRQTPAKRVD